MSKLMRILIADDHPAVRRGLINVLKETYPQCCFDEAGDGKAVLSCLNRNEYNLIILDLSLPDQNGMDLLKVLKKNKNSVPVLIYSLYPDEQYALRVLRAGASGYVNKAAPLEQLLAAVEKAVSGASYLSPAVSDTLTTSLYLSRDAHDHKKLSKREYEVLIHLGKGDTITEIAAELGLSVKTVSTYRKRILDKMKLENNAQLVHYTISTGLVE
jgi:DNA-binding NarL/FixJ family response regulator